MLTNVVLLHVRIEFHKERSTVPAVHILLDVGNLLVILRHIHENSILIVVLSNRCLSSRLHMHSHTMQLWVLHSFEDLDLVVLKDLHVRSEVRPILLIAERRSIEADRIEFLPAASQLIVQAGG